MVRTLLRKYGGHVSAFMKTGLYFMDLHNGRQ